MIEVSIDIKASRTQVWQAWIHPSHIVHWYFASPDWCCPHAQMDVNSGGSFCIRMEAKDGSFGFDFKATFSKVLEESTLNYTLEDGRLVEVNFSSSHEGTKVVWKFDPESENPVELQQQGWQAILHNFKTYVEQSLVA